MADVREQCLRAFIHGDKEVAQQLLARVPDPQTLRESYNRTLVHRAAIHGWHDICQILVEQHHVNPSDKDDHECSPLHCACRNGRAQTVQYLLSLPTVMDTVNDEEHVFGRSALELACGGAHLSVLEVLLREPSVQMPTKRIRSNDFAVLSLLATRIQWSTEFPIQPYSRVFMAGNSAAGKTTLTTALLSLDIHSPVSHDGLVTGVKTLTAGICPTQCSG